MKLVVEVPPEGVVADLPQSHTPMHRGMRHPRWSKCDCLSRRWRSSKGPGFAHSSRKPCRWFRLRQSRIFMRSHQVAGLTKKISSPGFGFASIFPQTFEVESPDLSTLSTEKR